MAPVAEKASQSAERGANSISKWAEANSKLAIALGLGTIAVGGAGVYYYLNGKPSRSTSRSKGGDDGTGADEKATGSSGGAATKKKKSKKSKRSKEGGSTAETLQNRGDADGPLLDEASDQELMTLPEEEIKKLAEDVS